VHVSTSAVETGVAPVGVVITVAVAAVRDKEFDVLGAPDVGAG
jgi:hypothetical protein